MPARTTPPVRTAAQPSDPPAPSRHRIVAGASVATATAGLGSDPTGGAYNGGQTTVLVALVVALGLVLLVGLSRLGAAAVDRAQARTAADAAALAGVVDEVRGGDAGRQTATDIAAENGATLTGYRVEGTTVEVTVRVDDAQATSRADRVRTVER